MEKINVESSGFYSSQNLIAVNSSDSFRLPNEIELEVFAYLSPGDLLICSTVSKHFLELTSHNLLWALMAKQRHIHFSQEGDCKKQMFDFAKIFRSLFPEIHYVQLEKPAAVLQDRKPILKKAKEFATKKFKQLDYKLFQYNDQYVKKFNHALYLQHTPFDSEWTRIANFFQAHPEKLVSTLKSEAVLKRSDYISALCAAGAKIDPSIVIDALRYGLLDSFQFFVDNQYKFSHHDVMAVLNTGSSKAIACLKKMATLGYHFNEEDLNYAISKYGFLELNVIPTMLDTKMTLTSSNFQSAFLKSFIVANELLKSTYQPSKADLHFILKNRFDFFDMNGIRCIQSFLKKYTPDQEDLFLMIDQAKALFESRRGYAPNTKCALEILIDDPHFKPERAIFHYALQLGNVQIIELLVRNKYSVEQSDFDHVIKNGYSNALKFLLNRYPHLQLKIFQRAVDGNYPIDAFQLLFNAGFKVTPFAFRYTLENCGSLELLQKMIHNGYVIGSEDFRSTFLSDHHQNIHLQKNSRSAFLIECGYRMTEDDKKYLYRLTNVLL